MIQAIYTKQVLKQHKREDIKLSEKTLFHQSQHDKIVFNRLIFNTGRMPARKITSVQKLGFRLAAERSDKITEYFIRITKRTFLF